jgi:hypothetical protein
MGFDEVGEQPEDVLEEVALDASTEKAFAATCGKLANAASRETIGEELIRFIAQDYSQAALLVVKKDAAAGWLSVSKGRPIEKLSGITLPVQHSPAIAQAIKSKRFYLGPLLAKPEKELFTPPTGSPTATALLVPIQLAGRVVALIAVADTVEALAGGLPMLQKLAEKASMAFEILIIKNKIMLT